MKAVSKMLESGRGDPSCFWLPERGRMKMEFLMCVYKNELGSPTLFHYAHKEKNLFQEEELNEVTEITYNGTSTLKMTFNNNKTIEMPRYLSLSFAWLRPWKESLFPKTNCNYKR